MKKALAFVPGHISGFFQVCDEFDDPRKRGSRNCGPCIRAGVSTEADVEEDPSSELEVYIDNRRAPWAKTSRWVAEEILKALDENVGVKIKHSVQAPIGAGYGMSGAGAIGVAMALSKALELNFSRSQVSVLAHRAEVSCGTGLGDVGPQMRGGLVIGLEPGCPPFGKLEEIDVLEDTFIVSGTLGSISTSDLLEDPDFRELSKKAGGLALKGLLASPNIRNFMEVSREFAFDIGTLDDELGEILDAISPRCPWGASVVMLGRAIFAPCRSSEVDEVRNVFLSRFDRDSILVSAVDFQGARFYD